MSKKKSAGKESDKLAPVFLMSVYRSYCFAARALFPLSLLHVAFLPWIIRTIIWLCDCSRQIGVNEELRPIMKQFRAKNGAFSRYKRQWIQIRDCFAAKDGCSRECVDRMQDKRVEFSDYWYSFSHVQCAISCHVSDEQSLQPRSMPFIVLFDYYWS